MPKKYHRMIGYCLLGGGAALVFGSMNHLYRMSEQAMRYREILAPHMATVPDGGIYSGSAEELDQKFAIRVPTDDVFQLKFLQISSQTGADASTTRAFAIGGMIMMGIGMRLASNSACTSHNKKEQQNKSCEATGDNVPS